MFTCGSALSPITDFKLYGNGPDATDPGPRLPHTPTVEGKPPPGRAANEEPGEKPGQGREGFWSLVR